MSSVSHIHGHISFFQLCDDSFEVSGKEKYDRQKVSFLFYTYTQVCNIQSYDTFSTRQKTCTYCTKKYKNNNNKNSDDDDDDDDDHNS